MKTFHTVDNVIYKVRWSPNGELISGSTFKGSVVIWDVDSGRELATFNHHVKAVFGLSWNAKDDKLILSGSGDGTAVVLELDYSALLDPHGDSVLTGNTQRSLSLLLLCRQSFLELNR